MGGRLESGRRVHGFAGDVKVAASLDREHLTAFDPDAQGKSVSALVDAADQLERGSDGAVGIVAVRAGNAERRHDGVADELLQRSAVLAQHVAGDLEEGFEACPEVLGVEGGGELGGADDVGEDHRRQLPLGTRHEWDDIPATRPATGADRAADPDRRASPTSSTRSPPDSPPPAIKSCNRPAGAVTGV